jgi:hypothetical protein
MSKRIYHRVKRENMAQQKPTTCWWWSYRMIYDYLDYDLDLIDKRLRKAGINVDEAKEKGLRDTDFVKAAVALHLKGWPGGKFNEGDSDGEEAFLRELDLGPLWVSRKRKNSYHIVVAVGYDDDEDEILYNDPQPKPDEYREHAVERSLDAELFLEGITGASASVQGWRYVAGRD